jgi:hypothetical protein
MRPCICNPSEASTKSRDSLSRASSTRRAKMPGIRRFQQVSRRCTWSCIVKTWRGRQCRSAVCCLPYPPRHHWVSAPSCVETFRKLHYRGTVSQVSLHAQVGSIYSRRTKTDGACIGSRPRVHRWVCQRACTWEYRKQRHRR